MVAPNYAKHRSSLAKKIGLGTKPRTGVRAKKKSVWPRLRFLAGLYKSARAGDTRRGLGGVRPSGRRRAFELTNR